MKCRRDEFYQERRLLINAIKQGLLLGGSFVIAYELSALLHELCHAGAAWISGGQVFGITVHPFSWSYSYSNSPHPFFHTAAGPVGSSILAVFIFLLLIRWARLWLLPVLLIGPISLIDNGEYLILDILMRSGGDACHLTDMGMPIYALVGMGTVLLAAGFWMAILLVRKTGLLDTNFCGRLLILAIGIILPLLSLPVWHFFFNRSELLLWLTYAGSGTGMTLLFAALPIYSRSKDPTTSTAVNWKTIAGINLAAIALTVFFLADPFYGGRPDPYRTNRITERPDDFPQVMVPPPYAIDPGYFHDELGSIFHGRYVHSYDFPESTPPEEIREYLENLHRQHGYIPLTYAWYDPNQIHSDGWEEKTEDFFGISQRSKQYCHSWIKIDDRILCSHACAGYVWRDDKFYKALVNQFVEEIQTPKSFQRLLEYLTIHPQQFDPNQIEQIRELTEKESEEVSESTKQINVEKPEQRR